MQKKIAHILSFRDRGWGGGRPKLNCLKYPENERFFYYLKGKNRSFLEVFETKGGGEGGSFAVVSKRQNMSDFFFASIPYGQTIKILPSWTCTQNTRSSSYDSCQAPQEIPNVEKYSQAQLTALCRHRDLYSRKKSGKSASLKTGKETSS